VERKVSSFCEVLINRTGLLRGWGSNLGLTTHIFLICKRQAPAGNQSLDCCDLLAVSVPGGIVAVVQFTIDKKHTPLLAQPKHSNCIYIVHCETGFRVKRSCSIEY
jgi:hypothetical protein